MDIANKLRDISKEDAIKSYDELKNISCEKKPSRLSRLGLKCLDYFFLKHRIKVKTRYHVSFYNVIKRNTKKRSYIDNKIKKIKDKNPLLLSPEELLKERYSVFQLYYGTINQFRPSEARRIYCILKPKVGILDFSSGWGGRCLAAMAAKIPYIGIDANTKLESSYKQMIETVDPEANVKMIFKPSETVDFNKFNYDLIFTSPPYYMLEKYEKMPLYKSKDEFIEKFFKPVILNAWKFLKDGGHMALNMPKEMYDDIKKDLPPMWKRMNLSIANRHPSNASTRKKIGTHDISKRKESIYIWKK